MVVSAAEVAPRDQYRTPREFRSIQFKRRVHRPVVVKTPIEKQELAIASPFDPLQKLLGDDLIGINVSSIHRGNESGVYCERLHFIWDWVIWDWGFSNSIRRFF